MKARMRKTRLLPRYLGAAMGIYAFVWFLADRSFSAKLHNDPVWAIVSLVMIAMLLALPGYICGVLAQRRDDEERLERLSQGLSDLLMDDPQEGKRSK